MTVQTFLVGILLAASIAYLLHRLWLLLRRTKRGEVRCAGCPLADNCKHMQKDRAREESPH